MIYIILLLLGCLGGFLSGMLGVGGAVVFVPTLTHFTQELGVAGSDLVPCVLANSLFAIVFSGVTASIKQHKLGQFYPRQILATGLPGVLSALLTTYLVASSPWYDKHKFGLFFLVLLLGMTLRSVLLPNRSDNTRDTTAVPIHYFSIIGLLTGILTALSGLGGGILMIPLFNQVLRIHLKQSTAISSGTIPILALPLVVYYAIINPSSFPEGVVHIGYLIPAFILPLITGVMLLTGYGVKMTTKLSTKTLQTIFFVFVVIVTIKMVFEVLYE